MKVFVVHASRLDSDCRNGDEYESIVYCVASTREKAVEAREALSKKPRGPWFADITEKEIDSPL